MRKVQKGGGKPGFNYKTTEYHYPIQMKHNLSNQSLTKKVGAGPSQSITEDMKSDKAKFFKKTFMEQQRYKKKKPIYIM